MVVGGANPNLARCEAHLRPVCVRRSWVYLALVSNVTSIIDWLQRGESKAAEELLPLVNDELRKLAAHRMAGEQPGHTPPRSSAKRDSGSAPTRSPAGRTVRISSPPLRRRCGESSWTVPAVSIARSAAAVCNMSMWMNWRSPHRLATP